jgi:hypothetical protein
MNEAQSPLDKVELRTLIALADLAARRSGFKRWRVRGWVAGPQIKDVVGTPGASWRLPRLRERGLLSSDATTDAARPRNPIVMWRVTQLGENHIATRLDRPARSIARPRKDPDDEYQIYISRRAWNFLSVLQQSDGFVTWDAAQRVAAAAHRSRFWHDDLTIIITRGFAARENRGTRKQPEIWVTATELGHQVRATDLKASKILVQLRVPGGRGR